MVDGITQIQSMRPVKLLFLFSFLSGLIFLAGCAHQPPKPLPSTGPLVAPVNAANLTAFAQPQSLYHIVGPSETLWRISKTYNVDINTLMRVNQLTDPTKISNGQKLLIPNTLGPRPVIPLYPNKRWTHIVIHHTATEAGNAFSIDKLHHTRGFWNGLGYHFLIDNGTDSKVEGQIEVGPRWIKQQDGAHANANGMNQTGIGISLIGNFSEQAVPPRMVEALLYLVRVLQQYYHIPPQNVIRHNEVPGKNTECPGSQFPWQEFKQRLH